MVNGGCEHNWEGRGASPGAGWRSQEPVGRIRSSLIGGMSSENLANSVSAEEGRE